MKEVEPHRFATWLLSLLVWRRDQEMLLGDLTEERVLLGASRSRGEVFRWYRYQVFGSLAPIIWANIRCGHWLKTLGAALVGYLAVAILVGVGDIIMSKLISGSELVYSLVSLAIAFPMMIIGGYIAACIRPGAAILLALVAALMGLVSLSVTGDRAPVWYQFALIVIGPVGSLIGGRFRIVRKEGNRL